MSPPQNTSDFGARLREARKAAGYVRRSTFARAAGLSEQSLLRYERLGQLPGPRTLARLAALLHVPEAYLRHGLGAPPSAYWQAIVGHYLATEGRDADPRIAAALRALDPSTICLTQPHPGDVVRIAELIAANLADRSPSADDRGKYMAIARDSLPGGVPRQGHTQRGRRAPAGPRAGDD